MTVWKENCNQPLKAGRTAVPFELVDDPFTQDILTPEGFTNAIFNTLRLREGSGLFQAPVCSTWVFMNLSLHLDQEVPNKICVSVLGLCK